MATSGVAAIAGRAASMQGQLVRGGNAPKHVQRSIFRKIRIVFIEALLPSIRPRMAMRFLSDFGISMNQRG
jgi:hypothetical protein